MIVWLSSYPRSGNSLLSNLIKHHLGLPVYSIYEEPTYLKDTYIHLKKEDISKAAKSKDIFFVKTHELPDDESPAIYIVRDGRDAIISYAHYILDNKINLPENLPPTPFTWALDALINSSDQFGGWGEHVLSWINRSSKTVTIHYEDLLIKDNRVGIIKSAINTFSLGPLPFVTEVPLPEFKKYHDQTPNFYRKGEAGSWVVEMPYKYHLRFWERYGHAMQELGYKQDIDSIRAEFVTSEIRKELEESINRITDLTVNLNTAITNNQNLLNELIKEREEKKLIEEKFLKQSGEVQRHLQELTDKEQVIQNFRESWLHTFIHGPFRRIPLFAKFYQGWSFLKRMRHHLFMPHIGVLNQYVPKTCDLPASYYAVEKLIQPAPVISIVTPSYNYAQFLERTLKSVINQGYPELEYIIQDGSSADGTVDVVKKYEHRLKHFESREDNGQSHAINLGFQHATGEIMAYLNADDVLLPGTLDYVANYFATHPEVDVVYGHRLIINEDDLVIGDWIMPPHDDEALRWADYIPQETLFWRRRIWEKAGGRVDENFQFAMDWDLLLRFQEAGAIFKRLPRFLAAFRVHTQQKTSAQMLEVGEKEVNLLRFRNFGREVDYREINKNLRPYRMQSVLHFWLHKLAIKKQQWNAAISRDKEPVSWYEQESVYFYSLHKAGTSLFTHVLRQANELIHVDYGTMFFDNEPPAQIDFKKYGYLYGIFRITAGKRESTAKLTNIITSSKFLKDKTIVFLIRDPRDILISMYYSFGFSHKASPNPDFERYLKNARKLIQETSLDEFVLYRAESTRKRFELLYKFSQECKRYVILRYEDLLENYSDFLRDFNKYVSIPPERQQELFLASRPRVDEDLSAHKRSGKSGQYLEKLKPETIRELNQKLKPVLEKFGYEVESDHVNPIKKSEINAATLQEVQTDSSPFHPELTEIISIGANCDAAHFLRENSLRRSAYPFDWNITPIQSVISLIENDFEGFLNESNLDYLQPVERMLFKEHEIDLEIANDIITPVICHRYNMLFPHDFSVKGQYDLEEVQKKYEKRIERLLSVLRSEKEIWFIRQDTELNDWQIAQYQSVGLEPEKDPADWKSGLANVLNRKYPALKFRLLGFNEFKELMKAE